MFTRVKNLVVRVAPPPGAPRPAARRAAPSWRRAVAFLLPMVGLVVLGTQPTLGSKREPNILFVMMDDVGIDQMQAFGYGGEPPIPMPTIGQVARKGIRFANTWSMPACTTSRAVFFTGRYPLRTNAYGALGPNDLANSHVSPFEMTTPKLLKARGYKSALFGKFHLALQDKSPFGLRMVRSLGWDYFEGWLDQTGDPSSIDTSAGIKDSSSSWSCGFVPGSSQGGADEGACYFANDTCREMASLGAIPPGRACRDAGGIFDANQQCQEDRPQHIDFTKLSGHYVSPLVINHENGGVEEVPTTDIRARTYRGTSVVDAAIRWIKKQPADRPWMATVSFASAHTPVMQPPALLSTGGAITSNLDCSKTADQVVITNQMVEAMDTEIGRLLVAVGLATRGQDGQLSYRPERTDTMIVIVGDNGSFGFSVKPPFDFRRAKGTAYQTGVSVPLIVAGPLVKQPDRDVRHMVNIADVYQLFGEIAGIDVERWVPRSIDSVTMMPYLVNPQQRGIRRTNFTQVGPNLQVGGALNGPCTIGTTCSQIPVTKEVCEDNGGTWWGEGAEEPGVPAEGFKLCCDVKQFLTHQAGQTPDLSIQPLSSVAVRNERYKVVRNFLQDYDVEDDECEARQTDEFYEIDEVVPTLDKEGTELKSQGPLTPRQQVNYQALSRELDAILASQPECRGDGNIDGVVNELDLDHWAFFAAPGRGGSSWYDVNLDGVTDSADSQIIVENLGSRCRIRRR
jgi:hypothetical protein